MHKKMLIGYFGAIVATVFIVSSSTAINVVQTKYLKESVEIENSEEIEEVYVDPHLHLTKRHLPILKQALVNMENNEYKEVVERIIDQLEIKGTVDSEDVPCLSGSHPPTRP